MDLNVQYIVSYKHILTHILYCSCHQVDVYKEIGTIFGMACYNRHLLNIPFPSALFKKLLGEKPTLQDLEELSPCQARYSMCLCVLQCNKQCWTVHVSYTLSRYGSLQVFENIAGVWGWGTGVVGARFQSKYFCKNLVMYIKGPYYGIFMCHWFWIDWFQVQGQELIPNGGEVLVTKGNRLHALSVTSLL